MSEERLFIQEDGIIINNPGSIIYVNQNATGNNDGASWENAYTDLQSALNSANESQEIWVAQGTYFPTDDGDREVSFVIPDRVEVYGGFVGGETARDERDWQANSTILSGNIGNPEDPTDNSVHVVDISETSSFFTVLDGFLVVEGYASRFERDDGSSGGANNGAGIDSFQNGEANLNNLIIANNFSENRGAGISATNRSELNINNVAFINNNSIDDGGAIYVSGFSGTPGTITNSIFVGNRGESGGAIYILGGSSSDYNLVNNTFYNNQADSGGVLFHDDFFGTSPIEITNSIVYQNPTDDGNVFAFETDENNLTINNSIIQGGFDSLGENIIDADPLFIDADNLNFGLQSGSPAIDVGNNSAIQNIPNLDNTDFGGNTRIVNDTVDLGAYEFVLTQDDINNSDPPPNNNEDTLEGEPVYRFFIPNTGVHFYTVNEVEKDNILATQPDYVLEGTPYNSAPPDDSLTGVAPIYRFLNTNTGVHLYTISEAERESIETNLPNYQLEGIAYYGYTEQIENTTPVFRFYNPVIDAHFYTSSTVERDSVLANLPDYQLESNGGIAFYVEPIFNSATPILPPSNPETPSDNESSVNLGDILQEVLS